MRSPRNFSGIVPNCETISRSTKPHFAPSSSDFCDVGQIRSDWNVKEPVPELENRDTVALKCIRSQKNVRSAAARADRGEYLKEGGGGEGAECIFKIVTMQFRWRIHNESLESGAPLLPG